jgi:hypothetical protein
VGIVFFGTPHRGGNGVSLGKTAVNIITAVSAEAKNTLLDSLAKNSEVLENITRNFRSQLEDYQFVSCFETRKVQKRPGVLGFLKMVICEVAAGNQSY